MMTTYEPEGVAWRKSNYSAGQGNCVEVGQTPADVHVRDTKDRCGGVLTFALPQWDAFITGITR
jgi:hypothetical protein